MRKQKSPAAFGLDRYEKGRLQRALQTVCDKRTFIRLKAVLLTAEGMNIPAVAQRFEKSIQIVYRWIRTYLKTHSPASLSDAPPSRPSARSPSDYGEVYSSGA